MLSNINTVYEKDIFYIFHTLSVFLFTPAVASVDDFKTVRVGVYDNSPKIYKDTDGVIKGFWADITNYIAEKENWDLVYVYGTWEEGLARLEKGEIDLMVDVAVTEERKQLYDFNNETALLSWSVFYTKKGFDVASLKDFEGKNIAVMKSSVHYSAPLGVKNIFASVGVSANITDAKSMEDIFKLLDTNQADAGVVNWQFGILNESKYNISRTGIIFNPSELNYALPKNGLKNSYLIGVLDAYLKELKDNKDSVYYESVKNNFGESLGKVEVLPGWRNYFLIISGLFIALVIVGLFFAKRYQKILKREIAAGIHEIKESAEKYSAVINQAQDGIVIVQDQIVKFANKAINIIGYTDAEVVGKPFIKLITPEEQKKIVENYEKRIAGEKVNVVYETKLAHKNGSTIDVEFSSGIMQYDNRPAVLVMVRDITERKKIEKATASLNELRNKLIVVVSHQMRTPLTAVKWNLEVMLRKKGGEILSSGQRSMLQAIYGAVVEMIRRIGDMLVTLDIEENRVFIKKEKISLDSLLKSVMVDIQSKCDIKNIEINLEVDDKNSYLFFGDAEKIRTVFEHLLNNAVDYTKVKGKIAIKLGKIKDKIRFEVADNGIGVPTVEQPLLFNRFFRGSNSFLVKPDATGLGLTIAKFYIEKHSGKIGFESVEGKGSKFWFELPVEKS